jgi:quercetin dioxygenase-like cupin family protein
LGAVTNPHGVSADSAIFSNRERVCTVFGSVTARRFEFPDGSLYDLVLTGASTNGARTEVEVTLGPTHTALAPHVHPQQVETYEVLDGELQVLNGGEWQTLKTGEILQIPAGTVHTYRNRSGQNVQFRNAHEPSLDADRYLERLYWLSAMNRIRQGRSLTSALYGSLLLDVHKNDQVLASSGARLGVRALAQVARLLRMRVDR